MLAQPAALAVNEGLDKICRIGLTYWLLPLLDESCLSEGPEGECGNRQTRLSDLLFLSHFLLFHFVGVNGFYSECRIVPVLFKVVFFEERQTSPIYYLCDLQSSTAIKAGQL